MKYILGLAVIMVLTLNAIAQENQPTETGAKPDRWHGLILDQSTPEDVIKLLGTPVSDKIDRLRIFDINNKWITTKQTEKVFRKLQFNKIDGINKAELSFLEGKLIMIELTPEKEPLANAMASIYGIDFAPKVSGLDEAVSPHNYERNQGRVYPKTYPSVYSLIGVSPRSFIGALVANNSFGSILKQSAGVRDQMNMPGKIKRIQIISRKLENKDGADALK